MKFFQTSENNKKKINLIKPKINHNERRDRNNYQRNIHFYFDYEIEKNITFPDDYQETYDMSKNRFVPFFA